MTIFVFREPQPKRHPVVAGARQLAFSFSILSVASNQALLGLVSTITRNPRPTTAAVALLVIYLLAGSFAVETSDRMGAWPGIAGGFGTALVFAWLAHGLLLVIRQRPQ